MSALGSEDLLNSATGRIEPLSDQPGRSSVLRPFCEELSVDEELKLSHENFKQTIVDFFKDKHITPLSQLTATPAFPTPHVLAQFASKAYKDYKRRETGAQYETRLALPEGWKLLTTASNGSKANGYFGAAYWHPEHQQVVIAHRGTKLTNFGAIFTDVVGVMFKRHVPQMGSASTFAHKVVEVLRKFNQGKGTNFQVFFTGHSLGGWLGQITTLTTKYLTIEGNRFLKSNNVPQSYHPHTVVFDSPGCKDMLSKMADELDVRLDGRSIDIEHLDITSYLSAPNRINTCNKHLGTVYRIFPDLSDMGWWKKHTALYNIATHSMDKIVEAFDPATGQVDKDEQGKLKIQVVVDWPVADSFSRGKEYKSFFNWANHFNDYNPEVTDEFFPLEGYTSMRYQTKIYEECVSSLNVFCQQERQFLGSYHLLRQLPAFFKPKELFSVIEGKQAQEQAEILLQEFEVANDTIRCTNADELQTLIPYVKMLLELFPQLGENTKGVLTPQQIGNNVYQFVTKRYVETLHQSPLDIKTDDSNVIDFLNSDEQKVLQLRMVDGDAWTGLIKVYQVLEKTPSMKDRINESHYTILTLEHLLLVNQLVNLNTLLQSITSPHLLMMSCETNQLLNVETKQTLRSLFSTLRQKDSVKIILTTQSEDDTVTFLQDIAKETLSDGFVTGDEQLTWGDLTRSSQEKLLENVVNIQGSEIALNQLISANSPLPYSLPIAELLEKRLLKIGEDSVSKSSYNHYDERYYIDRTFSHKVIIKHKIFNDNRERKFSDLLARNEHEFKELCQLHANRNVHWLEKDKSGNLVWQQSQGTLETLRRYIDTDSSHTYTAEDLDKFLEQAQHQRVMLISDTAGMGKSTVLTHLSKHIKQKFPAKWVVRIDVNDHTDALKALKQEQIDKEKAIETVSKKIVKHKSGLEVELFKQCCEQKQHVKIVIMLDGFDEISPSYKETVIDLLQALRQTAVEQLWVTTRPHLREDLEDKLQQLSYTLIPFSEENQFEFLKRFWCLKDWFTEVGNGAEEEGKTKLEMYAKHLISKLSQSLSDRDKQFTGIPLQCRMLAEAFDKEVKTLYHSSKLVPELPLKLDLLGLYKRFIERKYEIYLEEKGKISTTNVCAEEARKELVKNIEKDHQILALKFLFAEGQLVLLHINKQYTSSDEKFTRTGIVQIGNEGKLHFIHRTFAEFYVADYFVKELTKVSNISQQIRDFLLQKIFLEEEYRVIRVFIEGLLSRSEPSNEVIKDYGNQIHNLGKEGLMTLHTTACEGNAHIIGFLLKSLKETGHTDTLVKLLLAQDYDSLTVWHVAVKKGQIEVLRKLRQWAKEVLTKAELNNMYLAKDRHGRIAWHTAAMEGQVEVLHKLWDWAKEVLTQEDLNNMLLAKDKFGSTAWHMAAWLGQIEVLHKLWEWAKEVLIQEEFSNTFLATDDFKKIAWHMAAARGEVEVLYKIWEWAKEVLTQEDLNNMFLAKDHFEKTAWHLAAMEGQIEILHKIWEWAKELLTQEELNNMFLAKDKFERTAWRIASEKGQIEVLKKLWECAKEVLTQEELNNMFLGTDDFETTAWYMAAVDGQVEALHKLWERAKNVLTQEELSNLFLAKGNYEKTAWHLAATEGHIEILHKLWEWAKEVLKQEELNCLFLTKDNFERTAWHMAAAKGQIEVLHKLWEWAKEVLTQEEINSMFLAQDKFERTVWHIASEEGQIDVLEKMWEWAKEVLTPEELNSMFLHKDVKVRTGWHIAMKEGKIEILRKMCEWAKEVLTQEEFSNMFLGTDDFEGTAWHMAAGVGQIEALHKLCERAKNVLTQEELRNLFLAKDNCERTAWHMAATEGQIDVLHRLWEWAKEVLTPEELKKLFLGKDKFDRSAWHMAAAKGQIEVLHKLWEWAKEVLKQEELNSLFLFEDNFERTAWHMAAAKGQIEVLHKLWEWAKEVLTQQESNKIFLANDIFERTAWHMAAASGQIEALHKLWDWAKMVLTQEESNKMFLAKDTFEKTAWHMAAESGQIEVLHKLWEWAKEVLTQEEYNNMFLAKDKDENTAWHMAAASGQKEVLHKLWEWAKEVLTQEEFNNMFLAKDKFERTAWHIASEKGQIEVLHKLWEWSKKVLTQEELNNMFLDTDDLERSAWHLASAKGQIEVLHKLWEWAKEVLTQEEFSNMFLAKDKFKSTTWHMALSNGRIEAFHKLWEWAKEILTQEELKNMFLATDDFERTAWHMAARSGQIEVLNDLWEWAGNVLNQEELNTMFLAKDRYERAPWHIASKRVN